MSEKVWLLLNEADFVLPFSTLIELSTEGNMEEGGIYMPSASEPQPKGTDIAPAFGKGNRDPKFKS